MTNNKFEQQAMWQQQLSKITKDMNACRVSIQKLNPTQTITLHEIKKLKKGESIHKKVKKYGIGAVLCSGNVRKLLHLDLITSVENSKDRRRQDLKITEKGAKVLKQAEPQLLEAIATAQADVKNIL